MAKANMLVLDGSEIKFRLEAERTAHQTPVHVDWVRFTCLRRNVVPSLKTLVDTCTLVIAPYVATADDYAAVSTIFGLTLVAACAVWGLKRVYRLFSDRPEA